MDVVNKWNKVHEHELSAVSIIYGNSAKYFTHYAITQSIQNNIIYTTVCSMQQIYYIHNVVQMQLYVFIEYLFIFIINLLHTTQGCVYNTGEV